MSDKENKDIEQVEIVEEDSQDSKKKDKKEDKKAKKEVKKLEEALRAATVERAEFIKEIDELKKEIVDIKLAAQSVNDEKNKLHDRLDEEKKEIMKYRAKDFLIGILPTIDMLESALSSKNVSEEIKAWLAGFEMILRNFQTALEAEGVEEIDSSKGKEFDHDLHNAISEVETDEVEPGHIVETKQKGYTLKGKLLRPASVVVAKNAEANNEEQTTNEENTQEE